MQQLKKKLPYRFLQRSIFLTLTMIGAIVLYVAEAPKIVASAPEKQHQTLQYQAVPIDVSINGDGQYSFVGDVAVQVHESFTEVRISEPFLVGYSISSVNQEGIWILDKESRESLIHALTQAEAKLTEANHIELADQIAEALCYVMAADPYRQAST